MTFQTGMKWFAVAICVWIVAVWTVRAASAIRAKKFGLAHLRPVDFVRAVIGCVMSVVFFYGILTYPDGPYAACASHSGYCGKQGQPHTFEEFRDFSIWQTTLLIVWPLGMLGLVMLRRRKYRDRATPEAG